MNTPSETPRTDAIFALLDKAFLTLTGYEHRVALREAARCGVEDLERELAVAVRGCDANASVGEVQRLGIERLMEELRNQQKECGRLLLVLDELPKRLSRRLENLWSALAWNCEVLSVAQKAVTDEIKDALANK